jgi:hypothetical protein
MKKFLLFISFIFCYGFVYAGLSVDPAVTNISGEPGSMYEGKYNVKNTYDKPISVTIELSDWNSFVKDIDPKNWVNFEKTVYYLSAGETIQVPYKVFIHDDFKGSISSRINFAVDQEKGQMISISISVPIYVTVLGTENIDFDIETLSLYNGNNGNVSYKMVLENKGNVHIRHSGTIEIYTSNKKKLLKTISIPETVPTYCGQKRNFADIMLSKNDLKKGKYVAIFKINALGKQVTKEIEFKLSKLGEVVTK